MNYNVTVNGKVYSVTVEKTGAAAPVAAAPVADSSGTGKLVIIHKRPPIIVAGIVAWIPFFNAVKWDEPSSVMASC